MKNLLNIVATPIGNLSDLSPRAKSALQQADLILAEDTRRSSILLKHYGIQKKILSYHRFKEKKSVDWILKSLSSGKKIALICDAGTPCISDPGQVLVEACQRAKIQINAIPGPCSIIQALVLAGFAIPPFQFVGFLPKKPQATLKQILCYPGVTVAFESPHRLLKTLKMIESQREIAVIREMTKTFEECLKGTVKELFQHFKEKKTQGEIVIVFGPGEIVDDLPLEELISILIKFHGLSLKEAIQKTAALKKIPKTKVYKKALSSLNL